jgi:uncharacterized phage protein (TIGR01671 family)
MSNSKIFRCWDGSKKAFAGGISNKDVDWNTAVAFRYYESHPKTVLQQCTGKKDLQGNWIFDGDIVSFVNDGEVDSHFELRVQFDSEEMWWVLKDTNEGKGTWGTERFSDYYNSRTILVIGNIFEGVKKP